MSQRTGICSECGETFVHPGERGRVPARCQPCKTRPRTSTCASCSQTFEVPGRRGCIPAKCPSCIAGEQFKPIVECLGCDIEIAGRGPLAQYCSRQCREWTLRGFRPGASSKCEWCSNEFAASTSTQKFCSVKCRRASGKSRWPCEAVWTDARRAAYHERLARKRTTQTEPIVAREIYERDSWTCGICSDPVDQSLKWPDPGSVSLDHVIPLARSGSHTKDNVQCAHLYCNTVKGARELQVG